jgi:ribosomal protein S18 acetylase RimI-like enzyme
MTTEIVVRALSPELLGDYLAYFDYDAFPDNPRWAACYCHFHQARHEEKKWRERGAEENRAAVSELILRGELRGYLAYVNDYVVGWCNANGRMRYTTFDPGAPPEQENIAMIVCFNVAAPYRNRGVARSLMQAALEGLRREGYGTVYAFTRTDTTDPAANHHGPLKMYLDAGFEKVDEREGSALVRKSLASEAEGGGI